MRTRIIHIRRQKRRKQRVGGIIMRRDITPRLLEVVRRPLQIPGDPGQELEERVSGAEVWFVLDVEVDEVG